MQTAQGKRQPVATAMTKNAARPSTARNPSSGTKAHSANQIARAIAKATALVSCLSASDPRWSAVPTVL